MSADKNAVLLSDGQPCYQQIEISFSSDIRTAMKSRNIIFSAIEPRRQGGEIIETNRD
jgi:hypothetical protein